MNMNSKPISKPNSNRLKYIGNFLRNYRLNEGLTQLEVSEEANIHRNTIHHLEAGKNVTLTTLFDLCDYYDISLADVILDID